VGRAPIECSRLQLGAAVEARVEWFDRRQLIEVARDNDMHAAERSVALPRRSTRSVQSPELVGLEHADLVCDEYVRVFDPLPTLFRHSHGFDLNDRLFGDPWGPTRPREVCATADVEQYFDAWERRQGVHAWKSKMAVRAQSRTCSSFEARAQYGLTFYY
jgi:hypothetical protein